jgi:hypothetical protein
MIRHWNCQLPLAISFRRAGGHMCQFKSHENVYGNGPGDVDFVGASFCKGRSMVGVAERASIL